MSQYLEAFNSTPLRRPPIWLMRQAGRYMPSYRQMREKHSLREMFLNPHLAAEVTMQPIEEFGFDAAILFSDILIPLLALGLDVDYHDQLGPIVSNKEQLFERSCSMEMDACHCVYQSIEEVKRQLDLPLIGFVGGPFTLLSYILEEKGKHGSLFNSQKLMYEDPLFMEEILDIIVQLAQKHIEMQVQAGCDAIQIFDSWAGMLPKSLFFSFAYPKLKKLLDSLYVDVPITVFMRNSSLYPRELSSLPLNAISVDHFLDLQEVIDMIPQSITVQGNLDPHILLADEEVIESNAKRILDAAKGRNFIFNLGHGVLPQTPIENVHHLVSVVRSYAPTSLQMEA